MAAALRAQVTYVKPDLKGHTAPLTLHWDGQGFCLYYKVLEKGRFPWPSPADGAVRLTSAQLAMLWEGIDWRRPAWTAPPTRVV